MTRLIYAVILCVLVLSTLPQAAVQAESPDALKLWYKQPAAEWTQAVPIGNGRLGCTTYGEPKKETIQFNEDSLWGEEELFK